MCNRYATTREHVPPRCFFPRGHREQLITVPSCPIHNSSKSDDDEYLRLVLASSITSGDIVRDEIYPKVKRSIKKAPKKIGLFKNLSPINIEGIETGTYQVDMPRLLRGLEHISKGIYFHEYGTKWLGSVTPIPPSSSILRLDTSPLQPSIGFSVQQLEEKRAFVEASGKTIFASSPQKGHNPEIFYYQILENQQFHHKIFRLVFFGGVPIVVYVGDSPSIS